MKSCSDIEGVLFGLSVFVCSSPFPLFSVFVCLLRLALCLRPFFSSGFSFDFLFFPSPLFCRSVAGNGAETERQSLLVLAFDNLKKT
jgi:hypothetical protein